MSVPLVRDPASDSFCFTRFALPFGYHLAPAPLDGPSGCYFEKLPAVDAECDRRRYLTAETAMTLFDRAWWFTLKTDDPARKGSFWQEYAVDRPEGQIRVRLAWPRLVLFERPPDHEKVAAVGPEKANLLRTGFLLVDVTLEPGSREPCLDDLLALNEPIRYLRGPYPDHLYQWLPWIERATVTTGEPVVDRTKRGNTYAAFWRHLLNLPVRSPHGGAWIRLFPSEWNNPAEGWLEGSHDASGQAPGWLVYADDRAFVWTAATMQDGMRTTPDSRDLEGSWVRLLNVDTPRTGLPTAFEKEWVNSRTYRRWEHFGTLYGFCYHAGAMIGGPCKEPPVFQHFRNHYFDLVLMLLYLRVCTFRFSHRLSVLSARLRDGRQRRASALADDLMEMRREYASFTNLYRFPLLSNQQQALEMYSLARSSMDVDALFEEVEKEIQATDEYLAARQQRRQGEQTTRLAVVATVGLALTLGFAPFQVNATEASGGSDQWPAKQIIVWTAAFLAGLFLAGMRRELLERNRMFTSAAVLVLVAALVSAWYLNFLIHLAAYVVPLALLTAAALYLYNKQDD